MLWAEKCCKSRSLSPICPFLIDGGVAYSVCAGTWNDAEWKVDNVFYRGYSSSAEPKNIGILGGGITGLTSAYYFSKNNPGAKITIYESGARLGGWLHSDKVEVDDGYVLFEKGPRTLRPAGNGVLTARLVRHQHLALSGLPAC